MRVIVGLLVTAAFMAILAVASAVLDHKEGPQPAPVPAPLPTVPDPPPTPNKPCPGPWCPKLPQLPLFGQLTVGGPIGPDGKTEVQADLPVPLRAKNVGGRDGAGLCVFTSIMHSARFQNERKLWDFQQQMRQEKGGGWPEKVDKMIAKYGPGTRYLQYEGKDPTILAAALASGRMPAVTYCGKDQHYNGRSVAHMVNLVYLSAQCVCILDNNFPEDNSLVWMSGSEFMERWCWPGDGWAVVLLSPSPPPVPSAG